MTDYNPTKTLLGELTELRSLAEAVVRWADSDDLNETDGPVRRLDDFLVRNSRPTGPAS